MMNAPLPDLLGEHRTKPVPPKPHGFVADIDTALEQQVLDLAQRQRVPDIHHHREANDFGRTIEIAEGIFHPLRLGSITRRLKPLYSDNAVLHPNLAGLYRRNVENLHASLDRADSRTEAAEILRGLVESIRVRNLDDGIEIELVGEITNMIKTAQTANLKGKAASEEAASLKNYRSSVKVVAGVGFEPTTFSVSVRR